MHGVLEVDLQYQLPDEGGGERQALADEHLGDNENQLVQVGNGVLQQHGTQTFLDALLLENTLHSDKKTIPCRLRRVETQMQIKKMWKM